MYYSPRKKKTTAKTTVARLSPQNRGRSPVRKSPGKKPPGKRSPKKNKSPTKNFTAGNSPEEMSPSKKKKKKTPKIKNKHDNNSRFEDSASPTAKEAAKLRAQPKTQKKISPTISIGNVTSRTPPGTANGRDFKPWITVI